MDGLRARASAEAAASKEEAAMDAYLSAKGLYRKRVAKDGSCLFRAVAEQVLHSQSQHLEVRKSCINYLRKNRAQFEAFIEGSFDEYLKRLENPQEWVGQVEISALSLMFKKEFVIYQEPDVAPARVTDNGFSEKIMLCFSNGNHYDIIYPAGFADRAGLCQSIIYELLYKKVFGINVTKHVSQIEAMNLRDEDEVYNSGASGSDGEDNVAGNNNLNQHVADMNGFKSHHNGKLPQLKKGPSVVPAGVLRSLNQALYRNVEYEVWMKSQRDQQKLDFSIAACMQYSVGDKCKVRIDSSGAFYNAHIQEVVAENGPAVVFVEELGEKHVVPLKNLKPVPLTICNTDGWNTVPGRKIKKSSVGGPAVQFEKDYRGQKNSAKPVKTQTAPPSRQQQATGSKPHGLPSDQNSPSESKGRSRTPPKVPGRKLDRDRGEESSYYKRESIHFGLTPEERREKQVFEESKSLYEMQNMDSEAFPVLSACVADTTALSYDVKKNSTLNREKNARRKSEAEDPRTKAPKPQLVRVDDQKTSEETIQDTVTSDVTVLPSTAEQQTPTTVPSPPPAVTNWSAPMPACTGTGSGSTMLQPQVTTSFSPLPVSVPAVSQPLLPLSQTLNPYQDPLYPGFPLNEKGERITSPPPYSYCKNGGDLPNDKSILHFFYNLGIKAYTCPMWPPHLYLHPLHQAYLNLCRMYPNINVYPQNNWLQEVSVNQSEVDPSVFVQQNEFRNDDHGPQPANICSPAPLTPPVQTSVITEPVASQPHDLDERHNFHSGLHEFESTQASKAVYSQHHFGQGPYLGPLPVVPPLLSQMWYGYPYQGYIESPVVQHNIFIPPQDRSVPNSVLPGAVAENLLVDAAVIQPQELLNTCKPDKPSFSATVAAEDFGLPTFSVKEQEKTSDRPEVMHPSLTENVTETQVTVAKIPEEKQSKGNESGLLTPATNNLLEERRQRVKEESSEDEREVSHMLSSGRSKNFYNQSYGSRRSRNERFYQPNRGGYQYSRNEEGWRGARGREDGYSHSRSMRGRLSRRRPFGEPYRQHHE